ncbi:MAG: serine hydrolase [Bacteroidetes bacterium]|nr:serine hydrolase [Bacteroidota bacterium]
MNCNKIVNPQIDQTIETQMIMQNLPGVAVGVFRKGRIIHLKGYGFENIEKEDPITTRTVMHWASVSKSVGAVAALQLQEDPSINFDLSDLVTDHCSYWPNSVNYTAVDGVTTGTDTRHGQITIRHLLQNRSGINHYGRGRNGSSTTVIGGDTVGFLSSGSASYTADADEYNAPSAVGLFSNSVLDFTPGSNYRYTTYGHNLAGAAIEEASPNGYVQWVEDNIADVMNLNSLQVANEQVREGHDMPTDGILKILTSGNKEHVLPGGGWESNICDFTKYAVGLASDQYYDVSQDSIWNANNSTNFTNGASYSYGVWHDGSNTDLRVWHGGKHRNMRTYMHFFPSDTTGVVVMSPVEYSNLPLLTRHIYNAINERNNLYAGQVQTPLDKCRVDMENDDDRFNGVWRKTGNDVIIRTGRTHDEFYEEVKRLRQHGYICKDIEPFLDDGVLRWDGVFQKNIPETKIWRNASKGPFVDKCEEMVTDGYRLMDVETYKDADGDRLWAGLFEKTNQSYAVRLERSTEAFANVREQEQENGRKLIDVEVYRENDNLMWSGVFRQGSPNLLNRNYTTEEFTDLVTQRRNNGFKLIDVEHYTIKRDGQPMVGVAGIWESSTDQEKRRTYNDFCTMMDFHDSFSNSGYELLDWERIAR